MRVKNNKKLRRSMSGQCLIEKLEGRELLSAGSAGVSATFVPNLYRGILVREGSSVEVASWEAKLSDATHPMTPAQVAAEFLSSPEYRTGMVRAYYRNLLGRDCETEGLNHWTNEWSADQAPETVIAGIIGSPEYATKNGGATTGIIHQLYVDLLGRQADDAGAAHWESQVVEGGTITQVADAMQRSLESRQIAVKYYYEHYLNREAEPIGLANWMARINAEGSNQAVVLAEILGAPEFYESQTALPLVQATPTTSTGASGSGISFVGGACMDSAYLSNLYYSGDNDLWLPAYKPSPSELWMSWMSEIWTSAGGTFAADPVVQHVNLPPQQNPLIPGGYLNGAFTGMQAIAVGQPFGNYTPGE